MEYRILGRTNLKVSALAVGTWQLSGPLILDGKDDGYPDIGSNSVINLIHGCEDLGINLIDSAEIYGAGEGERRVGQAIQGRRERWILSTKFGLRQGSKGERVVDCAPKTIRNSLEGNLNRLRTDYVDIYLYHTSPEPSNIDESREVLETLKKEGKLRFYGISTNNELALSQLLAENSADIVMFSQSLMNYPSNMLSLVKEYNLGALIRGAFDGGLLSGKYFRDSPDITKEDIRYTWMSTLNTQRFAVLEEYVPSGSSMVALALRYLLDFKTTHSIVLGSRDLLGYQNAVKAFDLKSLDQETHAALEQIGKKLYRYRSRTQFRQKVIKKVKSLFFK